MQTILDTGDLKYILLQKIGLGGTCSVYKGYEVGKNPNIIYAIKIFKPQNKNYFEKEILINNILPKNYFLALIKYGTGYIYQENKNSLNSLMQNNNISEKFNGIVFYKIEELAENGELFNYIYEVGKSFSEDISVKIFAKIVNCVKILHENSIIHCDIKPENILVGNDFGLKLIDFGFSQKLDKNNNVIYNTEGSFRYCSPEIRKANIVGYDGIKSDIFSLGVLLFVITVGRFPFNTCAYSDKKYRLIMTKKYDIFWENYEKCNLSKEFKDLINNLICFNPNERLSIEEILRHPWIKNNTNYNNIISNESVIDEDVVKELKKRKEFMNKKVTN